MPPGAASIRTGIGTDVHALVAGVPMHCAGL
ncbi:MAG: 2-C-methyl-D-erythritol 2,4-cyclodiphosphate synthase, partial [Propionibacterium sp.]|nr:2-C-methyl-D-erythritol 2,4-cyclodiphosphate synthase [Propionibacterium sp.]